MSEAAAASSGGAPASSASTPAAASSSKPTAQKSIGTNLSPGNAGAYKTPPAQTREKATADAQSFTPSGDQADSAEGQTAEGDPHAALYKQKVKLKVDGKDMEVPVEQLVKDYNLKQASMKRFEEAAQVRKQAEQLIEQLFTDPESFLDHPKLREKGLSKRQIAEQILKREIEREMMSPEQLRQQEVETELEQLRREKAEREQAKKREEYERTKQAAEHKYSTKFQEALEAAKLPKTPFTVKRLAEYQRQALRAGYDLSAAELGELVADEVRGELSEVTSHLDAETLINIFGEDIAKKIREYDLTKVETPHAPPTSTGAFPVKKQSGSTERRLTIQEHREQMRRQFGI